MQPNENGVKLLQDWYRVDVASGTDLRVDLTYTPNGEASDLDLYFFRLQVSSSTREPGQPAVRDRTARTCERRSAPGGVSPVR